MSSGYSGTGSNYDVKYYRCEWTIDPRTSTKTISGTVTVYFKTIQTNVSAITIDLNKTSFNNGGLLVKYHGTTCSNSFTGNILNITLPSTIPATGTLDSVSITYSGIPPAVSGAAQGYQVSTDGGGKKYVNTLSESYEDRDWWPCKADMQDKADSMTMVFNVPWVTSTADTFWVAANGVLVSSPIVGNSRIFTFKTHYPIASYLVGISVARFNRYYRTINIGGTTVPVEYDLLAGKNNSYYTNAVNAMDKVNDVVLAFSQKFGDYPFKDEKYGFYDGLLGADGMEHQTFSCIASNALTSTGTLIHEMMHQWFGDKVTFATWNNLWLAEGFARYSEALGPELVPTLGGTPATIRGSWKTSANGTISDVGAYIPNSSMTTSNLIWNSHYGTSVYNRGGMVVSMLRTLLGDDKFFQACREYLSDPGLAYGSATTEDLRAHMESVLGGFDLTGFFNSFVYGNGYPTYNVQWQAVSTDSIRFGIYGQTKSSGSNVSYYYSVLPIRVQGKDSNGNTKDTVIVLYDQPTGICVGGNGIQVGNSSTPQVYLGFTPTTVTFDPFNMSLATGSTTKSTVVATGITNFNVRPVGGKNLASLVLSDFPSAQSVILEHSFDGTHFESTGEMADNGNGNFTYSDDLNNTTVFYRAKVTLNTGHALYSDIVKVNYENNLPQIGILTNPARGNLKVKTQGITGKINYTILDMGGKMLLKGEKTSYGEMVEINIQNLSRGPYLLHIQSATAEKTIQFLSDN